MIQKENPVRDIKSLSFVPISILPFLFTVRKIEVRHLNYVCTAVAWHFKQIFLNSWIEAILPYERGNILSPRLNPLGSSLAVQQNTPVTSPPLPLPNPLWIPHTTPSCPLSLPLLLYPSPQLRQTPSWSLTGQDCLKGKFAACEPSPTVFVLPIPQALLLAL